jgi:hypothetical protein
MGPNGLPKTTRPPCPFYGFIRKHEDPQGRYLLTDNHGNACAFAGGHSPCKMEHVQKKPAEWKSCVFYNNEERLPAAINLVERSIVYPDELHLEGAHRDGIPFKGWFALMTRE